MAYSFFFFRVLIQNKNFSLMCYKTEIWVFVRFLWYVQRTVTGTLFHDLPDQQPVESYTIHPSLRTALLNVGFEGKHSHHSLELLVTKYSLPTKIKVEIIDWSKYAHQDFSVCEKKAQIIQYKWVIFKQ